MKPKFTILILLIANICFGQISEIDSVVPLPNNTDVDECSKIIGVHLNLDYDKYRRPEFFCDFMIKSRQITYYKRKNELAEAFIFYIDNEEKSVLFAINIDKRYLSKILFRNDSLINYYDSIFFNYFQDSVNFQFNNYYEDYYFSNQIQLGTMCGESGSPTKNIYDLVDILNNRQYSKCYDFIYSIDRELMVCGYLGLKYLEHSGIIQIDPRYKKRILYIERTVMVSLCIGCVMVKHMYPNELWENPDFRRQFLMLIE